MSRPSQNSEVTSESQAVSSNEPQPAEPIEKGFKMHPVSECYRQCVAFNQFSFSYFLRIERDLTNDPLKSEPIWKYMSLATLKIPTQALLLAGGFPSVEADSF